MTLGNELTGYSDSNQDSYISLQGGDGVGGTIDTLATGAAKFLGDNGGSEIWQAQSFIPVSGYFSEFDVEFSANVGSPTGLCTWRLMGDSAGDPLGIQYATGTFTIVPSSVNTIVVSESDRFYLDGATTYWLWLEVPDQATNVRWQIVNQITSSYADGNGSVSSDGGVTWTPSITTDLAIAVTTVAIDFGDRLAQSFQITGNALIDGVQYWLKKVGAPTDNISIEIQTNVSSAPSGVIVANGTSTNIATSTLTTSFSWITFSFASAPLLDTATTYWLVLKTSGAQSDIDFVIMGDDKSAPSYANGELKSDNGASWDAETADAPFSVGGSLITSNYFTPIPALGSGQTPEITGTLINDPTGELDSEITDILAGDDAFTRLKYGDGGELTIATGAITVTNSYHNIDTEADASEDTLLTINGMASGDICYVRANNTTRTVIISTGGNIKTPGEVPVNLDDTEKICLLFHNGTDVIAMGLGLTDSPPFFSGVHATKSGVDSYAKDTDQIISFPGTAGDYDTESYKTSSTLFTLPRDGTYLIICYIQFQSGSTGDREAWISLNRSTSEVILAKYKEAAVAAPHNHTINWIHEGVAGDEIEFYIRHSDSGNIDVARSMSTSKVR